jgi:hypothetical protein
VLKLLCRCDYDMCVLSHSTSRVSLIALVNVGVFQKFVISFNREVLCSTSIWNVSRTVRFTFWCNGASIYYICHVVERWLVTDCRCYGLLVRECRDFIYKNSVRTSEETQYISATETNRLMLFRETVAVYCKNYTEHINTLCGQNAQIF